MDNSLIYNEIKQGSGKIQAHSRIAVCPCAASSGEFRMKVGIRMETEFGCGEGRSQVIGCVGRNAMDVSENQRT